MNTNETMQQLINAKMKKGTRLVVEVDDALGKDLVSIRVNMNGTNAALLKMISAMAINKKLSQLIKATAAADELVSVEAIKFNVDKPKEEGGEA